MNEFYSVLESVYSQSQKEINEKFISFFSNQNKPDFILVNGSSIAIALKYNQKKMEAPTVILKEKNLYAKQLISTAKDARIPIIKNKILSQILYKTLKVNDTINQKQYSEIAFILAKIYYKRVDYFSRMNFNKNESDDYILNNIIPDIIKIEIGNELIPLFTGNNQKDFFDRINSIRRDFIGELGILIPSLHINDNLMLLPGEYNIIIKTKIVGHGNLLKNKYLCINPGTAKEKIKGLQTKDPTFNLPAQWITKKNFNKAKNAGYTVVAHTAIICTHLTDICRRYASDLFGREEVHLLLDMVSENNPNTVDDLINCLSVTDICKILKNLLKEHVSIHNICGIFETLADNCNETKDIDVLTEKVRQYLGRIIYQKYLDKEQRLYVIIFDPETEKKILDGTIKLDNDKHFLELFTEKITIAMKKNHTPILLTSQHTKMIIKNYLYLISPDIIMLSCNELEQDKDRKVIIIGSIKL